MAERWSGVIALNELIRTSRHLFRIAAKFAADHACCCDVERVIASHKQFRSIGGNVTKSINQETVNDTAKLLMHRLIAREVSRNPSLIEQARDRHVLRARQYPGYAFVGEWNALLELPLAALCAKLVSRDAEMVRLRISSPFSLVTRLDLTDYGFRRRIWRAARRLVGSRAPRSLAHLAPV